MASSAVEKQLIDYGNKLQNPPRSIDELLSLLDDFGNLLSRIDQSPPITMLNAFSPALKSLIAPELFSHRNSDVSSSVAYCIVELARITAPEPPYSMDVMDKVLDLIVNSLSLLSDEQSESYSTRIAILETFELCRMDLLMLDSDCGSESLVVQFFDCFVDGIRDFHPDNVFSSMEKSMGRLLVEWEETSREDAGFQDLMTIVSKLLSCVRMNSESISAIQRRLVKKVLNNCRPKIKQMVEDFVGSDIDDYDEIVRSICEGEHSGCAVSGSCENLVGKSSHQYTWEEIVGATSSFSENLMIGNGATGAIYRGNLQSKTVAVKVFHSANGSGSKQFHQELEILGRIEHPHILRLLGACTDHCSSIYEYMENGSLAARLECQNDTQPIPWYLRFRIACEVAKTLDFLHNGKAKPTIHHDLKPEHILLDRGFASKVCGFGLSTKLEKDQSSQSNIIKGNGNYSFGTIFYVDPEYLRTGLVSPKSDIYAFGMIILQLLTGKPVMAVAHTVETAVNGQKLVEIIDPKAGSWPMKEAKELAVLGLSCIQLRRVDRPDLRGEILPKLEKLREEIGRAQEIAACVLLTPPPHFICPIRQDVMDDPCVAADGYTYDRTAILGWFGRKSTSPMTNLLLPNKNLVRNFTLRSAIAEWKSKR